MKVPHLELISTMTAYKKELALIFGFDTTMVIGGRVLVYDDAGLISDQTLELGDNQFLIHVESLATQIHLYFIHAGGPWSFAGISGYVV